MPAQRWRLLPVDEAAAQHLYHELQIPLPLCRLLAQRGIRTFEEARRFFRPIPEHLHDPFEMATMPAAVDRLEGALVRQERILLYGDYDVDGTTSVALLYSFLSGFSDNLDFYLPDRDREGYGVSRNGVEYARETGATLVVAMDCGIKAHAAVGLARSYGIDFIVCDHHLPGDELPPAVAVLDPKRPDCPYPYKELSGCGVTYKLIQALAQKRGMPVDRLYPLLDLVAVSIACDIVPMTGENRVLAHYGMQALNRGARLGLQALIRRSGRQFPLSVSDVVFGLGPLINAAGRLGDARDAVRLLLSADRGSALEAAGILATRNRERRQYDQAILDAARRQLDTDPDAGSRKSIVLFDPSWHKGVVGIAASRIAEQYHKPAVMLTRSGDEVVGSARSVPGFDLHAALERCAHLFTSFGGHAHAAGVRMTPAQVPVFMETFERVVRATLPPEAEIPEVRVDSMLRFSDITPAFWRVLRQFAPFGPENQNPVFWAEGVQDTGRSRLLANNHVRLSVRQAEGPVFTGIGFGFGEAFSAVQDGPFDLAFSLFEDNWQGERVLSLMVKAVGNVKDKM
ncbi:MAG: single-stranded-DNA-specific exonuclease RecJ [Bacteroidetes bacterium]|nr:MAG: single-stranded-DNA-specific exonuclease RecJ [Bacteroidota bacterium]